MLACIEHLCRIVIYRKQQMQLLPDTIERKPLNAREIPRTVDQINWEHWQFTEDAVLCFIRDQNKLMLIHKKTGLGKGKINAPGGRILVGESPREAAVRETQEEIGLTPLDLRYAAELNFIFTNGYSLRGFVFMAQGYRGTPVCTDEAEPFWCSLDQIPYDKMWEDDAYWLPQVIDGETILGRFIFEEDTMLSYLLLPLR
jgi:8-oxo-dGTP diphosphatase